MARQLNGVLAGGPALAQRPRGGHQAGWEGAALRMLEFVAYPALAGCALLLLCLGVVTWLPALAAAAYALHQWRDDDGRTRPFLGAVHAFGHYWRQLWRHALVSTLAGLVLAVNVVFLATRPGMAALTLLAFQIGLLMVMAPYHLALAVMAARDPNGNARRWSRAALRFAFATPRQGLGLLAVAIAAPVLTVPLAFGPLLFGGTLPLLFGLHLAGRVNEDSPSDPPGQHAQTRKSHPTADYIRRRDEKP